MLTRQPNPRTRVEVRKDPQEPAASSHVSLTPKSFAAPPPPPWLKWLRPARRRRAALPLLLGAPRRHRWCGRWPRHLHPRRREPIPAGPVALPPSTPPLPRPAAPRTAMKRAPGTPAPPSPRLYCFFSWTIFAEQILHGMVDMRCLQLRWTTSSSNSPWIWRQGAEELQLPKAVAKGWSIRPCSQDLCSAFDFPI